MKKAFQKLEAMAHQLVTAKEAENIDDALVEVVRKNPELYRESLTEGKGTILADEVTAALSNLSAEDRAVIEAKAMQLYLGGKLNNENDAYVAAIMDTPSVHLKCMDVNKNSLGREETPPAASHLRMTSQGREGQAPRVVTSAEAIREETKKKLKALEELGGDGPWAQLFAISLKMIEEYPDLDEKEAFRLACLDHPRLFQQWQDSLPKPSKPITQDTNLVRNRL